MMTTTTPTLGANTGWGVRDVTCLTIALAVHALLLLWKGGVFELPNPETPGEALISVNFTSEIPSFEPPAEPAPKQSLFSKMKTLIKGEANVPKPKVDVFAQKPAATKPDELEISKGQNKEVALATTPSAFKPAEPNLKQNTFKMATKDVPFKIATVKDKDALANVNAIPVQVGAKTTLSSRSFEPVKTPVLQSKTFTGRSGSSGEALAMGGGNNMSTPALNAGSSIGSSGATATPNRSTGREYSGGSGFARNEMSTLSRNSVSAFDAPIESGKSSSAKSSNFNITGALANRPILRKIFAAYEIDARVALRFRVDWSGRVLDGILVEISSGSPSFDQKVVAALKEWSFSRLPPNRANEIQEGVITFVFKGV